MQRQFSQLDFSNQSIYVGIDVHLKQWNVTILGERSSYKKFSQPADSGTLINYLNKNFPNASIKCAYEAGFSGFGLFYDFLEEGIDCIVVNAADVPTTDKEKRQKTDSIDSNKIAHQLRSGSLKPIYVPSWKTIGIRNVVRMEAELTKKQTAIKNQIKHFLYANDIKIPDEFKENRWGKRFTQWLSSVEFKTEANSFCLEMKLEALSSIKGLLKKCNGKVKELSELESIKPTLSLLRSIPGVGILSGMVIVSEIDEIKRFKSLDKLSCYVGLVPHMHNSGETEITGGLTTRGNKRLKTILIESSWRAIRQDPALMLAYNKLCRRMNANKAIIRICKKMLNRIRYVLIHNEPYQMAVS